MRADRRFPMLSDAGHSPPRNRIRELQVQPTDETLPGPLSQAILQRLAWHEVPFARNADRETARAQAEKELTDRITKAEVELAEARTKDEDQRIEYEKAQVTEDARLREQKHKADLAGHFAPQPLAAH